VLQAVPAAASIRLTTKVDNVAGACVHMCNTSLYTRTPIYIYIHVYIFIHRLTTHTHLYRYISVHIYVNIHISTRNQGRLLSTYVHYILYKHTPTEISMHAGIGWCVLGGMGWLQLVGSNYRSLLQKRPIKETIFCKRDI